MNEEQIRNSGNPNQELTNLINQNPSLQQNAVNYIKQNGGDPRTAFFAYAREHNLTPGSMLGSFANRNGLNLSGLLQLIKR